MSATVARHTDPTGQQVGLGCHRPGHPVNSMGQFERSNIVGDETRRSPCLHRGKIKGTEEDAEVNFAVKFDRLIITRKTSRDLLEYLQSTGR